MYRPDQATYQALRSSTYWIGDDIEVCASRNLIKGPDGKEHKLQPRLISVLTILAAAKGEVVPRQALIEAIWSDYYTGDLALNQTVSKLRKALSDAADTPESIETIVKTGYRLLLPVYTHPPVHRQARPLLRSWAGRLAILVPLLAAAVYFTVLKKEAPEPLILMEDPQGMLSPELQARIQQLATHPENYEQVMQELKTVFPDSTFQFVSEKKGQVMVLGR